MAYYLYDGNNPIGPFEPAELVGRPGFAPTTLVFPAGATSAEAWKPASSFPDIAAALPPTASAAMPQDQRVEIRLTLPPQPQKETEAPSAVTPPAADPASPAAPEPAAAFAAPSDKLVIVIDDDESVRSLIEMGVSMQGFQVVTAVNGHDASAKLTQRPADLIVTDLMMPGQGGYEFLRSLQAAGGPRVPVIVITGSTLDDSTIKMIRQEANVVEFLAKPVRMNVFTASLHKHLKTAPR